MRSLFTPSRIIVVLVIFSLVTFLWTFGLPSQLGQPSLPIIQSPAEEAKLHDPITSAPVPELSASKPPKVVATSASHGERPKEEDDHRWEDKTRKPNAAEKQTVVPVPEETGPAGHDDDGGRWNDKEKAKESGRTAINEPVASTTPAPPAELSSSDEISSADATDVSSAAPTAWPTPALPEPSPIYCKDARNAQHVMVVVKTSKAEIFNELSGHISGILSCVPNFAIFSDHEGEIDGIKVHDALRDISSETKQKNDEFREYSIIRADPEYKPDAEKTKNLDKWKVLPMVYQAYQMNPHAKFYAFIEADTGLSWTNLLQWVDRLDYRIPYYSGAQTFINKVQFAQRGSGILLSQGALRRYAKSYDERWAQEWEQRTAKECCGDYVLATALYDAHVELYRSWPLMQGEQPNTLDYTQKQWCTPAVTWHHMDNTTLAKSWDMQKKWTDKHGWDKPYLHRDAFTEWVQPHLKEKIEDWDNLGSDTQIVAPAGRQKQLKIDEEDAARAAKEKSEQATVQSSHTTQPSQSAKPKPSHTSQPTHDRRDDKKDDQKDGKKEKTDWKTIGTMVKDGADNAQSCKKVCTEVEDCLQWRYTTKGDGECHLSKVVKLGRKVEKREGTQQWTSGWMVERIRTETKKWECKEVAWKFYQ
ncbi:hypothetical protein E8E13_000830 [Curvularia kusanoi]|uniref:Glycosyltransferase family 31 protein n=1 Tax=Curvularia kusanoi TaxID=90978 RepID=A0A9P4T3X5_CURKU|nr:hypothetical protein E8E13_000830 [Curvularia kusanoi]